MKKCSCLLLIFMSLSFCYSETTYDATSFYTDFEDSAVEDCIIPCCISESSYNGPSNNAEHIFADGKLLMHAAWNSTVSMALVAGGQQATKECTVGKDLPQEYAYGIYSNTVVTMSYQLSRPNDYYHTNMYAYIISRKTNKYNSDKVYGPHPYRQPFYQARYDGLNLQICEYTYYADNQFFPNKYRVIASVPAETDTKDGIYTIKFTTIGGGDGDGVGNNTEPCYLAATLKYNGKFVAGVSAVDNPFDWGVGPEISGDYTPEYNPQADYNRGAWTYAGGEWERQYSWKMGNSDIRLPGWIAIGIQPKFQIGMTKNGIYVDSLKVEQAYPFSNATLIIFK